MKILKVWQLMLIVWLVSACSPTMRFKPGEIPQAQPIDLQLKVDAEHYVKAHIDESNYNEIHSGSSLSRLKRVVGKLSVAAGYSSNQFPVHLIDAGDMVNAAAFNGAAIVVYKALLDKVSSDADLATILGHEVGHILAKHYQDQVEEQSRAEVVGIGASILGAAASIGASVAGLGGASDIAGDITEGATGAIGYGAFVGSFSRTQEYEADHIGLILMARAGYDPKAAPDLWRRSEEIFGESDSSLGAFFGTHPASNDRVVKLEEAMPIALSEYRK
jgi:metalloendopeptidase OMA1, mitochondrial